MHVSKQIMRIGRHGKIFKRLLVPEVLLQTIPEKNEASRNDQAHCYLGGVLKDSIIVEVRSKYICFGGHAGGRKPTGSDEDLKPINLESFLPGQFRKGAVRYCSNNGAACALVAGQIL